MTIIIAIIKLLIILCIVASIHEFGHFLAAKLFKIGVNEFSIGFGPKIVQKKYKETMYSLRWIPLGGYVMIEGEGEESDGPHSFAKQHPIKKIIVLAMGVIFNIILAFVILVSIAFSYPTYTTEITKFTNNSAIQQAGLLPGDTITKINGSSVSLAQELVDAKFAQNNTTKIEYVRDNKRNEITLTDAVKDIGYIGVAFKAEGNQGTTILDSIRAGKPAEKAGLKAGDQILAVGEITVASSQEIVDMVKQNAGKTVDLTIKRDGKTETVTIVPDKQKQFDLGIYDTKEVATTIPLAIDKSVKTVITVVNSYIDLFKGKVMLEDVSSIVGIGVVVSKTENILQYLNILAIISLAIGVANLLPFPPLDGGKIVFVVFEWIIRRKIPLKIEAIVSYIGFGALMLLTVVVMFNDIIRIF